MVGLPCAGKSTWRTKFLNKVDRTKWNVLSTDDLIEKDCRANNKSYSEFFKILDFSKYENIFYNNLKNSILEDKNIIIDQTNLTKKSRSRKIKYLNENYKKIAIVFITDIEKIYLRNKERFEKYGKFIPIHIIDNMNKSFEIPGFDEFEKIKIIKN